MKLSKLLEKIEVPQSVEMCQDVKCKNPDHLRDLDTFTLDLMDTVQKVAEQELPTPTQGTNKNDDIKIKMVPGWNEEVRPYKEEA